MAYTKIDEETLAKTTTTQIKKADLEQKKAILLEGIAEIDAQLDLFK